MLIKICIQRLKNIQLVLLLVVIYREHIHQEPKLKYNLTPLIQGTKRFAGGWPSKDSSKRRKLKRPRDLQNNVDNNVPNALSCFDLRDVHFLFLLT